MYSFLIVLFRFFNTFRIARSLFTQMPESNGWPVGIGGVFHFAEAKHPASPLAHPPAAAARRAPLAELVFTRPSAHPPAAAARRAPLAELVFTRLRLRLTCQPPLRGGRRSPNSFSPGFAFG